MTTSDEVAIRLENVSKIYRLYGSQREQLLDLLGLSSKGMFQRAPVKEFRALDNLSLVVPRGRRLGVIGRNGAGKSTLLKLLSGNFSPTTGNVTVTGAVQALLGIGLGFHPEFTGLENAKSSLQYNGLSRREYDLALEGIIDFCELGEFLEQPFKTYSLGMQARLMFASATAVRPDILVVDEVLGAGDAYFIAKSKRRIQSLVDTGCTMLLVSHSTQQVLELCTDAIWLHEGQLRMESDALSVVKAYEEYIHSAIPDYDEADTTQEDPQSGSSLAKGAGTERRAGRQERSALKESMVLQEPTFLPHSAVPRLPDLSFDEASTFRFEALGGISRWASNSALKICGFSVVAENGITNVLTCMKPAKIVFFLLAESAGNFECRYGIAVHDLLGTCVTRIFSPLDRFSSEAGGRRRVEVMLNPTQIGPGEYTVGISVSGNTTIERLNTATRHDLLSRSFSLTVELQDSLNSVAASFVHTAEWDFAGEEAIND